MIKNNTRRIKKLRWVTVLIISIMLLQTAVIATIRSGETTKSEHIESDSDKTEETGPHTH